jgi:hypothetical protein
VRRVALLALCAVLSQSGCSAMFASLQSHNSRGTSCMDEPAFPAIDLVGGSIGAVALVYTGTAEESPGWLAIPGAFMLSGLIASFTVYACRNPDPDDRGDGVAQPAPKVRPGYDLPPDNVIPERTSEESEVRDATLEERGMTIPVYTPPAPVTEPPPKKEPATEKPRPIACRINPLTQCPDGWSCVLTDGDHGTCRLDSEFSRPKTQPPGS